MKGPRPGEDAPFRRKAMGSVASGFSEDELGPARHFKRSAPGEGQQQQALRIAAVQDQMSHPMGERLGLAGAGAGGDQQWRRRYDIAADAVFDSAAPFRVEAVQMPPAIDRLQLRVPFLFSAMAIASAQQLRNARGPVGGNAPRAFVRSARRA